MFYTFARRVSFFSVTSIGHKMAEFMVAGLQLSNITFNIMDHNSRGELLCLHIYIISFLLIGPGHGVASLVLFPFNPFTAPSCKVSGLNSAHIHLQTKHFPVLYQTYFQHCAFWWKSCHILMQKGRERGWGISNLALLLFVFKWHCGSERVNEAPVRLCPLWVYTCTAKRSCTHIKLKDPVVHTLNLKILWYTH